MSRCHFKGTEGNAIHAMLFAARLEHPLAAENDPQKGHPPLFVPDSGIGFGWIIDVILNHKAS